MPVRWKPGRVRRRPKFGGASGYGTGGAAQGGGTEGGAIRFGGPYIRPGPKKKSGKPLGGAPPTTWKGRKPTPKDGWFLRTQPRFLWGAQGGPRTSNLHLGEQSGWDGGGTPVQNKWPFHSQRPFSEKETGENIGGRSRSRVCGRMVPSKSSSEVLWGKRFGPGKGGGACFFLLFAIYRGDKNCKGFAQGPCFGAGPKGEKEGGGGVRRSGGGSGEGGPKPGRRCPWVRRKDAGALPQFCFAGPPHSTTSFPKVGRRRRAGLNSGGRGASLHRKRNRPRGEIFSS